MTPIPKSLLISLLAACLLVPGVVEGHEKSPVVASLITPSLWVASYTLCSLVEASDIWSYNLLLSAYLTVPGFGHLYAGDLFGFYACALTYSLGAIFLSIGYAYEDAMGYSGIQSLTILGYVLVAVADAFDLIRSPIVAKRHNKKHAEEKAESSRLVVYPALAVGRRYVGVGIGIGF